MNVFAVFNFDERDIVHLRVREAYPDNHFISQKGAVFVADGSKTTRQVADSLGMGRNPSLGSTVSGVVIPVENFWGMQSKELWEWIALKKAANA